MYHDFYYNFSNSYLHVNASRIDVGKNIISINFGPQCSKLEPVAIMHLSVQPTNLEI